MTASKPALSRRRPSASKNDFRELELPVKEAARAGDLVRQVADSDPRRQAAARRRPSTIASVSALNAAGGIRRRRRRQPARAPEIRHPLPARQPGVAPVEPRERLFLGADLLERVVGNRLEREPDRQRGLERVPDRLRVEQRKGGRVAPGRRAAALGRPGEARQPRAEQAVAGLQTMIEKRQRPIGRERGQPERQPRQLHGHRIEIDAVETAFGDRPADGGALVLADVARMAAARTGRAPLRTPARGTGTRRRETRRCPSPDRRCAARGSASGGASRTSGPSVRRTSSRRSAAACRTCRWPCGRRNRDRARRRTAQPARLALGRRRTDGS